MPSFNYDFDVIYDQASRCTTNSLCWSYIFVCGRYISFSSQFNQAGQLWFTQALLSRIFETQPMFSLTNKAPAVTVSDEIKTTLLRPKELIFYNSFIPLGDINDNGKLNAPAVISNQLDSRKKKSYQRDYNLISRNIKSRIIHSSLYST